MNLAYLVSQVATKVSFLGIPGPRHPILPPLALSDSCLFQSRCSNFLLREEKKSWDLLCASWQSDLSAALNSPKHLPFRNKNAFFYCPCSSLLLSQAPPTSLRTLQNFLKAQPQGLSMKILLLDAEITQNIVQPTTVRPRFKARKKLSRSTLIYMQIPSIYTDLVYLVYIFRYKPYVI